MSTYTAEPDTSDQLIVTVEQADALLEMIASNEKANRISSAALTSGLAAQGLAGANGLAGDAARILEPVRTAHTRICIRTVSPPCQVPCATGRSGPQHLAQSSCAPTWTAYTSARSISARSPIS